MHQDNDKEHAYHKDSNYAYVLSFENACVLRTEVFYHRLELEGAKFGRNFYFRAH